MPLPKLPGTALCLLGLLALLAAPADTRAEPVVVVAARSPVGALNVDQVAGIFLGKIDSYPDGHAAVPIDQPEGAAVRDRFYDLVAGKTPAQVKAYWSRIIFSGRGAPPPVAADDGEVRKRLLRDYYAIGYVERDSVDATLRIVYPHGN